MLKYDFIFEKGILFIRFEGDINKDTSKLILEEIDPLISDNGITNVVFNVRNIRSVDQKGLDVIYDTYVKFNDSNIAICNVPTKLRRKFNKILKYINEKEDEITILKQN